jgi:hypothetical protein
MSRMGPAAFPRDVGHAGRDASRSSALCCLALGRGIGSSARDLRSLTNSSTDAGNGGHLLDPFEA